MTPSAEQQLFRLASDNTSIYQSARQWFFDQGPSIAPVLVQGLEDSKLGSIGHWRILMLLQELAVPSTLPAILKVFQRALERNDYILLPGAMEALAVFKTDEALSALLSVLQSGEIDDVNHAAALLGDWGGDRAVDALIGLLDHQAAIVRRTAVQGLLKINTDQAQEALQVQRGREQDPDVLALLSSQKQD